ncbi:efflux RND transporter periplasmic adaptor subunit [Alienimonas californiensis]|uniref:Multidrug resistance protein MdtN n=1 Tax=Alienimonas californiensis TaxID=2527989 RepID=A0A517PEU1_9PLAN|nr:HlyD family efflux transporter periplasmic adaptor subunit [Alienimonas californiensis]QDT17899.1 multidrug resistance protein MdtN [Alienimonas californiensis]
MVPTSHPVRRLILCGGLAAGLCVLPSSAAGQGGRSPAGGANAAGREPAAGGEVVIRRRAVAPRDPRPYQFGLHLEPAKKVTLVAPGLGTVAAVIAEPGKAANAGAELVTLDSEEQALEVEQAKALLEVAQAGAGPAKEAAVRAAQAALDLAKLRASRRSARAPFAGTVYEVHVVAGQPVRPGDPLVTLAETSELVAVVPIDRSPAEPAPDAAPGSPPPAPPEVGSTTKISVEGTDVEATITALLPLGERFEPVRDLVASPALARVTLPGDRFRDGQTVYVPILPRDPVAEVPTEALIPAADGGRLVQVVRENVVRDLPVRLLGRVGEDRAFLSGPFAEGDEVILSTSRDLPDGTVLAAAANPLLDTAPGGSVPNRSGTTRPAAPATGGGIGF